MRYSCPSVCHVDRGQDITNEESETGRARKQRRGAAYESVAVGVARVLRGRQPRRAPLDALVPGIMTGRIFVGTAGWSLPRADQGRFAPEGTHLVRYAQTLTGVEINSSFYRPHALQLYCKWAAATPDGFRFSVKMPKTITHEKRLLDCDELLCPFLDQVHGLGERLGCILIQLPPSFEYDASLAGAFFEMIRALYDGPLALEPRNPSWFTRDANRLLVSCDVARVAADPARIPAAATPAGAPELAYFRLHGSPRIYWSRYDDQYLDNLSTLIASVAQQAKAVWCIFDNTASGSAIRNALGIAAQLAELIR